MALSSVQISIEFKEVMKGEKNKGESFEDYIKRLREISIENKNQSIESKPIYRKEIVKPKTETIYKKDPYENPIILKDKLNRDWKFPNKKNVQ